MISIKNITVYCILTVYPESVYNGFINCSNKPQEVVYYSDFRWKVNINTSKKKMVKVVYAWFFCSLFLNNLDLIMICNESLLFLRSVLYAAGRGNAHPSFSAPNSRGVVDVSQTLCTRGGKQDTTDWRRASHSPRRSAYNR